MTNNNDQRNVILHGRVIIKGNIQAVTGLHIGGAAGALEIGGVDSPVIRNPLNNQPYIPGSSLRGKMRSLSERLYGSEQNFEVGRTKGKEVYVHTCRAGKLPTDASEAIEKAWRMSYASKYNACRVCSVFGVTGDEPVPHPTSLVIRDAILTAASADDLEKKGDFPYTEIKWEATIDRVTSAATPRQIERVPAGAIFEGMELVYNIYDQPGLGHFPILLKALQLVEEDYLGGLGSRGGGKVAFDLTEVYARKGEAYARIDFPLGDSRDLKDDLVSRINEWVANTFADLAS